MRKDNNRKSGFTIIEVTLVIAIAGLIFLMVFVALPSMQRMSRDTRRKEDVATLMGYIKKYQNNNRGALPTTSAQQTVFRNQYLGDNFVDPDGTTYMVSWGNGAYTYNVTGGKMNHIMYVRRTAKCEGEVAVKADNPRHVAILYRLEGSGVYCYDQ